jgi:hypothetical protein
VVTVKGSSWTAGAADAVDVAGAAVVVVVDVVVVWAPSGRAATAARAARPDRIRSKAADLTGYIFIWSLGVEEDTRQFLVADLGGALRVENHLNPPQRRGTDSSEQAGECLGVMGFMGRELKLFP